MSRSKVVKLISSPWVILGARMTKAQSKVAVPPGNVVTRSVSNVTVCEPVEEVKMVSPEQPIPGGSGGGGGGGGGKIALASCTATAKGRPLHIGKHDLGKQDGASES